MKESYFFLIASLCLLFSYQSQAQVYLNWAASGANDGTSWTDAYNYISDALEDTPVGGQIWVAKGVYKPGGFNPSLTVSLEFPHDMELYGGFNGTETMLSQRDVANNVTVVSGDHNDDDVPNDFQINRSDNARHIMWLTDTITNATIIDGFTFASGSTTVTPAPAGGLVNGVMDNNRQFY